VATTLPFPTVDNYLLLGEGLGDNAFFKYLTEVRNIPSPTIESVDGKDKFGSFLDGLRSQRRFKSLKGILLVADNDDSPTQAYAAIKAQLNDIDFPSPTHPLEIARKKEMPPLAVLMLPYPQVGGDDRGCLETMIIPSVESAHKKHADCVDLLMECAGVSAWESKGNRDKAKLRCILSSVYEKDPNYGLRYCLRPKVKLIPLDHAIFDGVAHLIQNFPRWFESTHQNWADWVTNDVKKIDEQQVKSAEA
jgi:hypothetical protein